MEYKGWSNPKEIVGFRNWVHQLSYKRRGWWFLRWFGFEFEYYVDKERGEDL